MLVLYTAPEMSHVTRVMESWHTYEGTQYPMLVLYTAPEMSHVTRVMESWHTYEGTPNVSAIHSA